MRVHLLRHGEAVPREDPSVKRDAERPLNQAGREQIGAVAAGLVALGVEPDRVLASPFARARQTAKTATESFETVDGVDELHELRPKADPADTLRALAGIEGAEEVVLCGHRPHLPKLASYLLTGESQGLDVDFPKASVVTIDILLGTPEALGTLERHVPCGTFERLG